VSDDPNNENRIVINIGNIPSKEELTFISELFILLNHQNTMNLNYLEICQY
jgi:hypothetical protein